MKQNGLVFIVIIISIVSFLCLSIGFSHAYFANSKVSKNALKITTGNLVSNITYDPATQIELKVKTDEEALTSRKYDVIKINRQIDSDIIYTILAKINEQTKVTVDINDVRFALYDMKDDKMGDLLIGPLNLTSQPVFKANKDNPGFNEYALAFGNLKDKQMEKEYAIKAWLDESKTDIYPNNGILIDFYSEQKAIRSKSFYNISGIVKNVNGTPVEGAQISLQNGTIKGVSDANGMYTLKDVPEGAWNLEVSLDEAKCFTKVNIESGSEKIIELSDDINYNYHLVGIDSMNTTDIDNATLMLSNGQIIILSENE